MTLTAVEIKVIGKGGNHIGKGVELSYVTPPAVFDNNQIIFILIFPLYIFICDFDVNY